MNSHLKFAIAVLAIAAFAFTVGMFTPPGAAGTYRPPVAVHAQARNPNTGTGQTAQTTAASNQTSAQDDILLTSASQLNILIATRPASIEKVTFLNGSNQVTVEREAKKPAIITLPDDGGKQKLVTLLENAKIPYSAVDPSPIRTFFANWWPLLAIGAIIIVMSTLARRYQMSRAMNNDPNSPNGKKGMGSSRAKTAESEKARIEKVTFDDVAGCDEAVKELKRVVKGLVRPKIYQLFSAKLARGILLVGPPGTGKTLLARAVAGESAGTFSFLSGSDFVEMYVGVGASRVRELFEEARKTVAKTKKPHVIFIDEIDAVGGKRGGPGRNDERESTLNQLLVELDGIVSNKGIILIAATNRADMLDDALLRPGRFDAQVQVDLPDRVGREKIFAIHLRKRMSLLSGVTLPALAQRSFRFSGAEIMGSCERAACLAAERYEAQLLALEATGVSAEEAEQRVTPTMTMTDFDEGMDFVKYGEAMPSKQKNMSDKEKINTAYHEGGHAVVSAIFPESDPAVKITIMRRSKALGYVQYMPKEDSVSFTYEQAVARIVTAMAGRAAQEEFLGTCDTGASNDFQQGTNIARMMVCSWGMSNLGPISVGDDSSPLARGGGGSSAQVGQRLADRIDAEWMSIVNKCFAAAKLAVQMDRQRIEILVKKLLENETVLKDEWEELCKQTPSTVKFSDLGLPKWKGTGHE